MEIGSVIDKWDGSNMSNVAVVKYFASYCVLLGNSCSSFFDILRRIGNVEPYAVAECNTLQALCTHLYAHICYDKAKPLV